MMELNIGIHGFNTSKPENTVGKLGKFLDNFLLFNYGWFGLLSVLFKNKSEAKKLKKLINLQDVPVNVWAHSNGCAITVEAARQGAKIKTAVLINAALNIDTVFPDTIENIIVIYTKHDKATKAARFFDSIPVVGLFVINAWGAMGTRGYKGKHDNRVTQINFSDYVDGHSDFFNDEKIEALLDIVKEELPE